MKSHFPTVSVGNFEHVFAGWVYFKHSCITATYCLTETKLKRAFQQSQLERLLMAFKFLSNKLHHRYLVSLLLKFYLRILLLKLPLSNTSPWPFSITPQRLIQVVFDIGIPILGTLIWACPNLISSKNETTIKSNSSFLSNQQHNVNTITRK